MTDIEKARHILRLFEAGRDSEAYSAMRYMLAERKWPEWLTRTARDIDSVTEKSK